MSRDRVVIRKEQVGIDRTCWVARLWGEGILTLYGMRIAHRATQQGALNEACAVLKNRAANRAARA